MKLPFDLPKLRLPRPRWPLTAPRLPFNLPRFRRPAWLPVIKRPAWLPAIDWTRVPLKRIDIYLVQELIRPFLAGIAGFFVLTLGNTLYLYAELIVHSKIPVDKVIEILLYNQPANMVITFPVAFMFATLLAIGRMSKDSELTAMRSVGLSFRRILTPILLCSVFVSYLAFLTNDVIVPHSNRAVVDLQREILFAQGAPMVKENVFFKGGSENRYYYVSQIDRRNNQMFGVFIFDKRENQQEVLTAREARWDNDTWVLSNGVISHYDQWGSIEKEEAFREMVIEVSVKPEVFAAGERSPVEKSASELKTEIEALRSGGSDTRSMEVDYNLKFSLPLSTFFAALIAAPLGARFGRLGGFIGVALSIALMLIYQVVMTIARSLGNNGVLDPFMGAWLPNLMFLVVGAFLLWRVDR